PRALADVPKKNTDYLIIDVTRAQATSRQGLAVHWVGPSNRNPYKAYDWIEIVEGTSRVDWDWACPQDAGTCDGGNGATFIKTSALKPGTKYTIRYWSDGGKVAQGTLSAETDFIA
ncbi:hypothetical protein ACFWX8_44615, partial [Streptomyces violascens]